MFQKSVNLELEVDPEELKESLKKDIMSSKPSQAVSKLKKLASEREYENIDFFLSLINGPYSEVVRREATSAIGRYRDKDVAVEILVPLLDDYNPEVKLQALRGLLVFKKSSLIRNEIMKFAERNDNEMIKKVIEVEFMSDKYDGEKPKQHIEVNDKYKNKIILGDTLDILPKIKERSVHLTFTSPPYYNARDYSIYSSYEGYLDFLEEIFKEVHRITKDGRFLVVNTSPVIMPRVGRKYSSIRYPIPYDLHSRLVNNGWEFIDDIIWKKPDASVKNRIGGFLQNKKPLAYKPNAVTECLMVYRKATNKLIDWNLKCYSDEVIEKSLVEGDFFKTNVWEIEPTFDRTHSAVFPEELCDNVIKYYSMKGDLVYDPFAGSGTLAKSALKSGRSTLATEISKEYFERIKENLKDYKDEVDFIEFKDVVK